MRDAFHPDDLASLLWAQMHDGREDGERLFNAGGGAGNAISLAELTAVCDQYFGPHAPQPDSKDRAFDLPWIVMDSRKALERFHWWPEKQLTSILDEIADHVRSHHEWLETANTRPAEPKRS